MQSRYLNFSLLKEIVAKNQVTTVFQNGERFRSSKLNRQSVSDMSVRWILDTYHGLKASRETLCIVPISISCDRMYESANLATEMINGEKQDYTLITAF